MTDRIESRQAYTLAQHSSHSSHGSHASHSSHSSGGVRLGSPLDSDEVGQVDYEPLWAVISVALPPIRFCLVRQRSLIFRKRKAKSAQVTLDNSKTRCFVRKLRLPPKGIPLARLMVSFMREPSPRSMSSNSKLALSPPESSPPIRLVVSGS